MGKKGKLVKMPKIESHVRLLIDNGLIFEINRKGLHPLGLAIEIGIHPDNSKWVSISGVSSVDDDDEEGFIYDEETYRVGFEKYSAYLNKIGNKKMMLRKNKLGFIIQEMEIEE